MTFFLLAAAFTASDGLVVILDGAAPVSDAALAQAFSGSPKVLRLREDKNEKELALIEDARGKCKEASDRAVHLETIKAIAGFEEALGFYARALPAMKALDEVADCLLKLGAAWADSGRTDKAIDTFQRALVLSRDLRIDPNRYNPIVVKAFSSARAGFERAPHGSLTVTGEPKGAEVFLDGARVGVLPLSLVDLLAGEHWLAVRAPGRQSFAARTPVKERDPSKVEVFLANRPARTTEDTIAAMLATDAPPTLGDLMELERFAEREQARVTLYLRFDSTGVAMRAYAHGLKRDCPRTLVRDLASAAQALSVCTRVASEPARLSTPLTVRPSLPKQARTNPFVSILPLGIAQFAQHRPVQGALLLSSQLLLIAANVTAYVLASSYKLPSGNYKNAATAEALKWVVNISFGLLIADVIAGGIDGLVHRHGE